MKKKQARSWYLDKNQNGRAKTIQINYSPTIKQHKKQHSFKEINNQNEN